jgi:hypothetical protein
LNRQSLVPVYLISPFTIANGRLGRGKFLAAAFRTWSSHFGGAAIDADTVNVMSKSHPLARVGLADCSKFSWLDLPPINLRQCAALKTPLFMLLGIVALMALLGWISSWKTVRLKDEALTRYQLEAKQSIAEANKATSIANQQAAEARLELARIQSKMLPRRLTKAQQETLASGVSSLAPQAASLWYGAGDKESENFSWDIASALDAAGWKVFSPASTATLAQSGKPFGSIPRLQIGVVVSSNKDGPSMRAADDLVRELSALGFDARKAENIGNGPEALVVVTVQARPEGAQGEMKLNSVGK